MKMISEKQALEIAKKLENANDIDIKKTIEKAATAGYLGEKHFYCTVIEEGGMTQFPVHVAHGIGIVGVDGLQAEYTVDQAHMILHTDLLSWKHILNIIVPCFFSFQRICRSTCRLW